MGDASVEGRAASWLGPSHVPRHTSHGHGAQRFRKPQGCELRGAVARHMSHVPRNTGSEVELSAVRRETILLRLSCPTWDVRRET